MVVILDTLKIICTGGGVRTPTLLKEMDFESTASTNSATQAILNKLLKLNYLTYYKNQKQELYIIQNLILNTFRNT